MPQLAEAMGISASQIYRVYHGQRSIGEKFIIAAIKAFPQYKLDDLFYVDTAGVGMPHRNQSFRVRLSGSIREQAVKLRRAGLNYAEIGRKLGISRQRAWRITQGEPTLQKPDFRSKDMLTTSNVAQLLGVHPYTVRRWSKEGILRSYRVSPRGAMRFRREDIFWLII